MFRILKGSNCETHLNGKNQVIKEAMMKVKHSAVMKPPHRVKSVLVKQAYRLSPMAIAAVMAAAKTMMLVW